MIDAGIDIIRLGADFARFIPPAAPYAQGVGSLVEFVGFIKSGVELIKGDPRSMSLIKDDETLGSIFTTNNSMGHDGLILMSVNNFS